MSDTDADFSLLAREQRQIIPDLGVLRDDMAVLTAIVRQDGPLGAPLSEVRAIHSQHSWTVNRVRALEEQKS